MITKLLCRTKDALIAVAQDVLSVGGFWVVDGQTKTGKLIEDWHAEDQARRDLEQLLEIVGAKEFKYNGDVMQFTVEGSFKRQEVEK